MCVVEFQKGERERERERGICNSTLLKNTTHKATCYSFVCFHPSLPPSIAMPKFRLLSRQAKRWSSGFAASIRVLTSSAIWTRYDLFQKHVTSPPPATGTAPTRQVHVIVCLLLSFSGHTRKQNDWFDGRDHMQEKSTSRVISWYDAARTSRRATRSSVLQASDVCLVRENQTCSVPAS